MLVTLSPAKKLDWTERPDLSLTDPAFPEAASELAAAARDLSVDDLRKLMSLSEPLAKLNAERFRDFADAPAPEAQRPAAFAFAGDTYQGFEAKTLDADAIAWAQDHLRILSGLYGLLRPLDRIQPYRLEMGSRLKTARGASLYEYWGSAISEALNEAASAAGTDTLVNCASTEYFSAVELSALKLRVITPVFLEDRNGARKVVSFWAKRARGAMARYAMENRLTDPEDLKSFASGGYQHIPDLSEGDRWVFLRALD
ncbi:peroxide stress protein YaaA [Acidimangrovimonas sediminis]|uniref:peroxide stress protein YaaA n=1 Tax=Acidimangrovimonas sediminis TaxID=2056283 RepID=UPI000C8061CD|nr:peroxide stress protein YaaA [Acidimangrovimonas sediminis]